MALSQEEKAEAQKLFKRLEAIRENIRTLSCKESDTRASVEKEIFGADQKFKQLDEELKRCRAKFAEAELVYVYLASLCPRNGHKFVSCKPKNVPEKPGIYWDRQCTYCGVTHFTLFMARNVKNALRFVDDTIIAPVKKPTKIKKKLSKQQLRRHVLSAEKKIHRLEKEKDALQRRRDELFDKNQKKVNRWAGQLVRGIKKEILRLEEEKEIIEARLEPLLAKCGHRWTKSYNFLKTKCKLCGIPAIYLGEMISIQHKGTPKLPMY